MHKTTVKASPDIAFIKYWGKKNEILRLPENGSISMVLAGLETTTTVDFDSKLKADEIKIAGKKAEGREAARVVKQLNRIRKLANKNIFAKVISENNFPRSTGLSSSGSGMAALTYAASKALDLNLSEKELSILGRQASGTACRCACAGFVEWKDGNTSKTSFSETIFLANHWDLRDMVAVVSTSRKEVSSTAGHKKAGTSLFYPARLQNIKKKIFQIKDAIKDRDFRKLGELIEAEALEFHSILLTSQPPLIFWYPGTLQVMHEVQKMRKEGIEAYFTINTGFNVHVMTLPKFEAIVEKRLKNLDLVKKVITAKVGEKPQFIEEHLF
ncbi:MAG: diphosphomevalonate decarboxylase [Candidatus Woesebacteria bacterium]|jgi:diphosphomevalonate decarboxylase